jgi:hypothetical protein
LQFTGFEGENNKTCHLVRDGTKFERQPIKENFDVVIIGAGISGLTAAYMLRKKLDIKIIEKENKIGGASKRGIWKGIYYSYGTADTGPTYDIEYQGKKINFLEPLFKELDILWKKVPDPSDAFYFRNHLIIDPFCRCHLDMPISHTERKSFENAIAYLLEFKDKFGQIVIPFEANSPEIAELDKKNLRDIFSDSGEYFLLFLEKYSESTFGASSSQISAFEGLYYLSREMEERYACPGGNAYVSEALAKRLEGKIELNSTAVQIEQENGFCYVTYVDDQGSVITLQSKSVIMASRKNYAPYIIKGLHEDQKRAFRKIRYDSYIVANVLTNDVFYDSAFATYFDDVLFTDMIIADWVTTDGKKKVASREPEVYTLYCPLGERGRYKVLTEPAETWISKILEGLRRYFPKLEEKIEDIRLFRYGHHYVLGYPGFITGPRTIAKRPFGNIFFAKDDMQGVPCLESAVWSGLETSNKVLEKIG